MNLLLLALAGAAGTLSRYGLSLWTYQWLGSQFPYGTLLVNILGCFAIGLVGTLADERLILTSPIRLLLIVGFLGAFTTFSSFTYDAWILLKSGEFLRVGLNIFGTLIGCFIGLIAGVSLGRTF